jgi:hypothetical protein
MKFSAVYEEYRKCAFCGVNIHEPSMFVPAGGGAAYHDESCYELSITYPALVERLTAASLPAPRPGD